MTIILPVVLHSSDENNLSKGNHLAEDEPDVNHLDVRGWGQALHLADEDGGHHQHGGQVHTQGCIKEERLDKGVHTNKFKRFKRFSCLDIKIKHCGCSKVYQEALCCKISGH